MPGAHLQEWLGPAAALTALLVASYIQFRHIGLALIAVLAPLPGGILAIGLRAHEPELAYLCGFFIATVLASRLSLRVCEGENVKDAASNAWKDGHVLAAGAGALSIGMAALPSVMTLNAGGAPVACGTVLSCICAAAIPLYARLLSFGPEFITCANRARESRERWLDRLSLAVQPRWGWSVSGIALIFAVLGIFGADAFATARSRDIAVLIAETIVLLAIAYVATRDVRRTVAFVLAAAVLYCLSIWIARRLHLPDGVGWLALALSAVPALGIAICSAGFAREGDNAAVATLRALESLAVNTMFFCGGAAIALLALGSVAACILILCGAAAALIVLPALNTTIFDLFPPRASPDAYRIR